MSRRVNWSNKFAVAIAGVGWSVRTQVSFWVHSLIASGVVGVAAWLQVDAWRWVAVVFAITLVLAAELLNTAIEQLVKVLHPQRDEGIGRALDAAAGGVLVASIGAVIVGLISLVGPLWETLTR